MIVNWDLTNNTDINRGKPMSDKIEISVKINDQPATLADVSVETLAGLRDKAKPTVTAKPIEHGDYGYTHNDPEDYRLFVRVNGKINAYDEYGYLCSNDRGVNQFQYEGCYTITGNIFEDMV